MGDFFSSRAGAIPLELRRDLADLFRFLLLFVPTGGGGGVLLQTPHSAFTLPILLTIRSDLGRISDESQWRFEQTPASSDELRPSHPHWRSVVDHGGTGL